MTNLRRRQLCLLLSLWCLLFLIPVSCTQWSNKTLKKIQEGTFHSPPVSRIIRGHVAPPDRYPYMVRLTNRNLLFCGATLIAPDIVLTAQHCIDSVGALEIGRFNVSDSSETYETHVYQQVINHPRYLSQTDKDVDEFDYSLIKFYDKTQLDISPIRLNTDPNIPFTPQQEMHVMGWGRPSLEGTAEPRSNVLMEAEVFYIPNDECKLLTSTQEGISFSNRVFEITLCAGDFMERDDSCTGDSGGPIIIIAGNNQSSQDLQVGVTSYGFGCAHPELPGIYARTSYVEDWLRKHVCALSLDPPANFNCNARTFPNISGEMMTISITITLELGAEQETGWIVQAPHDDNDDDDIMVTYSYMPIGSYSSSSNATTTTTTSIQLPNNRIYTFTLFDSYGDGGSFATILNVETQTTLASLDDDDEFEFSVSTSFIVGTIPSASPTTTPSPTISPQSSTAPLAFLSITFDDYPEEAGWRMEAWDDDLGKYILLSQVFPGTYTNMTSVEEEIRLSSSHDQYKFTMTDNERDGLCCNVGQGWYKLTLEDGRIVAQGSQFVWEESTVFYLNEGDSSGSLSTRQRVVWWVTVAMFLTITWL